jgi:hypothetical protein
MKGENKMNKKDENNSSKINNRRDFKASNSNNTNAQEQTQPRSLLADLFKTPSDPVQAEAERDARFGRTPRNTNANGSFSK